MKEVHRHYGSVMKDEDGCDRQQHPVHRSKQQVESKQNVQRYWGRDRVAASWQVRGMHVD